MASVNTATIIGRLGQDPELRHAGEMAVTNFGVATDEYAGKGKDRRTEWHRVTVWAAQAEACAKYLKKGSLVYIQGRLQTREWQDKEGHKRMSTEIVAERVQFLDRKPKADESTAAPAQAAPAGADDDIPF